MQSAVRLAAMVPVMVALTACRPAGSLPPIDELRDEPLTGGLVNVAVATRQDLDAYIANCAGQAVLVDYWATWCEPCKQQFPHTVQLHRCYAADGLQVVSVSLDDPDQVEQVLAFLRENKATFTNFLSANGVSQKTFDDFEIEGGSLPYYQLYDRQGRLRHEFTGRPIGIEHRIEELLE